MIEQKKNLLSFQIFVYSISLPARNQVSPLSKKASTRGLTLFTKPNFAKICQIQPNHFKSLQINFPLVLEVCDYFQDKLDRD